MRHRHRIALVGLTALLFSPGVVRAHAIETNLTSLEGQNNQLMLQSHFSSGLPTAGAVVRLVPPQGQAVELGRTDSAGQLSFAMPKGANGDWELQVDGGPGHRDYLEMPVRSGQPRLDRVSEHHHSNAPLAWLAGLGGLGGAAMLLGLQRIRRFR